MSILVVCRSCKKSFNVSDKFAGQTGPCPNCKKPLRVPSKEEQVVVHGAQEFADGGRSVEGRLLTKPTARKQAKLNPVVAVSVGCASLAVLAVTWAAGSLIAESLVVRAIGLLIVSPPLAFAAYTFLRNDEIEPYQGASLYIRAGICALGYTILWGAFGYVQSMDLTAELWNWLFVAPPFLFIGALIAHFCLDLEYGDGFFHYTFYLLVTVLLRVASGMPWVWETAA